jgi:CxxC motif-containing protein (DUF1111 family)
MQIPDWSDLTAGLTESTAFRKYFLPGAAVATVLFGINWLISPSEAELVAEGRELFSHEWAVDDPLSGGGDGLGPVFNEKSCVACHFQGGVGGGGGVAQNVNTFEVLPAEDRPQVQSGVVHASATDDTLMETEDTMRQVYPIVPGGVRIIGGCSVTVQDFDPVIMTSINTPALFGVGLIDEISSGSIKSNLRGRSLSRIAAEFNMQFDGAPVGRTRTFGLGRVGRFGWRGQFADLREFVATACAVELGLTNHVRAQDNPQQHKPDNDAEYDMTSQQLDALVAFCRNLPRPKQVLPTDRTERFRVENGEHQFKRVGCADCHTPDLNGVEGIYSDFALYSLEPSSSGSGYARRELEFPIPSHHPEADEWQTPPLWGVADSAPYFHDGRARTLEEAIGRHEGQAADVTKRYYGLSEIDRADVICFLKSLRAPMLAERTNVTQKLETKQQQADANRTVRLADQ